MSLVRLVPAPCRFMRVSGVCAHRTRPALSHNRGRGGKTGAGVVRPSDSYCEPFSKQACVALTVKTFLKAQFLSSH